MLEDKILKTIKKYNLIENGDKIVVAVSGGPDSITLLNCLYELKESNKLDFEMVVAHINHGLRENAKIDEQYVFEFCNRINIRCFILHADIKKEAEIQKRGLEETGRIIRYKFFDEIQSKTNSNKIAIAHNSNDNVETIIMNIVRGSGLGGLKGIEAINGKYIRPLIETSRDDIESYCEEKKLNPRYDESNDDNVYTRNKIRNIVIPYIKQELNPNIVETITRLSNITKDDLKYLEVQTEKSYKNMILEENFSKDNVYNDEKEAKIILDLKKFNNEEKAIEKRVILYAINQLFRNTKGIEKIHIEDIIKLCNNNIGNKFLTPNKKLRVEIKNKTIVIKRLK